jgi:hypothetical protein
MLVFRFDEVLGFVLPGPIFNLGLLVLSPFIVQPLADGTHHADWTIGVQQ